ncbi:MAG: hypothetical protein K9H49_02610 [Bacteroidales bacterium]|nr:hypothetical protein [Bacteroidales bacterium]MCF8403463.1 hypothetical protein [Bacteroidales bacterium]
MENIAVNNWEYDAAFDAKEKACGDLVISLFKFFKTIEPGMKVQITAHDIGAANDIAAWCRSTNKELLAINPPYYLIEKK